MRGSLVRRGFAYVAMALLFSWVNIALAEVGRDGGRLFRQARFGEAEAWCEGVLRNSSSTARQLAEAHLYLAALQVMEGDETRARHHVRAWLALDADLALPPGLPLQLEELREELLRELPHEGITLSVDAPECLPDDSGLRIEVAVQGAPEGLLSTVALECGAASNPWRNERPWSESVQIEIPQGEGLVGGTLACAVLALGPSGATLRRQVFEVQSCTVGRDDGEGGVELDLDLDSRVEDEDRSLGVVERERRSPWVWVGVALGTTAVVAAAVSLGVVFGTMPDEAVLGAVELETSQ